MRAIALTAIDSRAFRMVVSYFVSKNDGTHHFSATVAEHEAAVVKWQRGGRALP